MRRAASEGPPLDRLALRPKEAAEALVEDGLVTVFEAAAFLRLSRSTIYSLMCEGELPFVKLGRSRRIPKNSLVQLAARELRGGVR